MAARECEEMETQGETHTKKRVDALCFQRWLVWKWRYSDVKTRADAARIFCFLCNLFAGCDLHLFFFLVFWASFSFHPAWYLNEYLIDRPGIHAAHRINTNKSDGHVAMKYCTGVSDPLRVYCYINFLFFWGGWCLINFCCSTIIRL